MSREPLPQRELCLELRFQVDHAQRAPSDLTSSIQRIRALIDTHPRGMRSRHVLHNLGLTRLAWIDANVGPKGPDGPQTGSGSAISEGS